MKKVKIKIIYSGDIYRGIVGGFEGGDMVEEREH
jgi:hypothetical protein